MTGLYWEHPRQLILDWADFIEDPQDYQDLRNRLRSRDDYQFRSPLLELYLHKSLRLAGYSITVHPRGPASLADPTSSLNAIGRISTSGAIVPGSSPEAKAAAKRRLR